MRRVHTPGPCACVPCSHSPPPVRLADRHYRRGWACRLCTPNTSMPTPPKFRGGGGLAVCPPQTQPPPPRRFTTTGDSLHSTGGVSMAPAQFSPSFVPIRVIRGPSPLPQNKNGRPEDRPSRLQRHAC